MHYLEAKQVNPFTKEMGVILSAFPFNSGSKRFEVSVVNERRQEPFFGMRVFPVINMLDSITKKLVCDKLSYKQFAEKWRNISEWYIEIDAQIFDLF